jgi:hypothetical protein
MPAAGACSASASSTVLQTHMYAAAHVEQSFAPWQACILAPPAMTLICSYYTAAMAGAGAAAPAAASCSLKGAVLRFSHANTSGLSANSSDTRSHTCATAACSGNTQQHLIDHSLSQFARHLLIVQGSTGQHVGC